MILRLYPIVRKEFRHLLRDWRSLGVLLFLPVFLLVMFGYAISLDIKHIPLAVYDEDKTKESRELVDNFLHSEYFDLSGYLSTLEEADNVLAEEKARVVLVIPQGFSNDFLKQQDVALQVLIDGSNSNIASVAQNYVQIAIADFSRRVMPRIQLLQEQLTPLKLRPRVWFNPELLSSRFLIPGLISLILVITAVISTSLSIVKEKEQGTMEQIIVSPIRPIELIFGKIIPYFMLSLFITVGVLILSYFMFGVYVKGSYWLLLLVVTIFLIGCLGLGIVISTIAKTQQVAFMLAVMITVMPSYILSGFVFPIRNMPFVIQLVTYLFPTRYFLSALRHIMIKGVGLGAFWHDLLGLVIFAASMVALSMARLSLEEKKR